MSDSCNIELSQACILDFPFELYPRDFRFIVNGETFKTSQIVADLFSQKIKQNRRNDPTLNEFSIQTKNPGDFNKFLNLINFKQNDIDEEELPFFIEIIEFLECKFIDISNKNIKSLITFDNVFERIQNHSEYQIAYSKILQKEIDFLSEHFYLFDKHNVEKLLDFKFEILERIISNPKIKIKNEDQLVDIILDISSKSHKNLFFLQYVDFSKVSSSKNSELFKILFSNESDIDLTEYAPPQFKKQVIKQLEKQEIIVNKGDRYYPCGIPILYEEGKEFKGIINYIKLNCDTSIYNLIDISASHLTSFENTSNIYSYKFLPSNVIIYDNDDLFFGANQDDPWILFDFKENKIIPKNYSMKTIIDNSEEKENPKTWIVEGSNNKEDWQLIDSQFSCESIKTFNTIGTFKIENPYEESYRYIRITQKENWINNTIFVLSSIEFYGYLISKDLKEEKNDDSSKND